MTIHVDLQIKDRRTVAKFERHIASLDAVLECRRMFGKPDYLITVAVADPVAYEALYMNELAPITGVGRVDSQFTMKLVKSAADFTA